MADAASSPPRHRMSNLPGFLPLNEETSLSTRGQKLPQLIQSRSSVNLSEFQRLRRVSSVRDKPNDRSYNTSREESNGGPGWDGGDREDKRMSVAASVLLTPQMRSQRLIGNSNPRYRWEQYWKTEDQLKQMKKPIRKYYERNNYLIQQYMYIDRLLDSSLPHNLIQEYNQPSSTRHVHAPSSIAEEAVSTPTPMQSPQINGMNGSSDAVDGAAANGNGMKKLKRTPKALYKVPPNESTPLLMETGADEENPKPIMPDYEPEEETSSGDRIVTIAIYINLVANIVLLIAKIIVTVLTSSLSVLASLVDAALDFLSTAIVWTTTRIISRQDRYQYPVGRRRLEPIGVLVFSIIMITSFFQVALEGINRMTAGFKGDQTIVALTIPAIVIMASTVVIKFLCWLWCRFIKNSSVQALAQDAMTDVIFNIFSIIFPLIGYYAHIWWLDPLGGILLSLFVIFNWSSTSASHIRNLTGAAASADERNVLLYLTMRFAKTIKQIQGLQAYHAGDKLNVEVDIVLDEHTSLRDSHDLGESLQYVLESVPTVDRAFVHQDYAGWNIPSHMQQQDE
ncbi:hypothetical protein B0A49_02945 [Cryomyces minteri]|uniref:Cation efflux protein transmembrane domain-containing protein n=1 Tax=Cryomyces minteri TaxID=331657 RepID=A0A4U0XMR0_9PEZI|nr:hypothetical protein B0A49_02945 [Cryomyces minteri]